MDHCTQQPCVYSFPEHNHHTQTVERREGGREGKREGGMRGIVYVLAVKKDDFSSFKRDDLSEYSRAPSQTEREDEDEG